MKSVGIFQILAVLTYPAISFSQTHPIDAPCAVYFGVLQDDAKAPGRYVARMTASQADWYAKNGRKQYPGMCLSLEKAQYLIVWTVSTQTRTFRTTETRTATAATSTTGYESGTFSTYGSLSTWGTYSGSSSSSSTSTVRYQESVPVTIAADHCSAYVLKSIGPTIWTDIATKVPQPPAIFSTETRGPNKVKETGSDLATNSGLILGTMLSHAVRREPTVHALDDALKFISTQPIRALTAQAAQVSSPPASTVSSVVSATGHAQERKPVQSISYSGIWVKLGDAEQSTVDLLRIRFEVTPVESKKPDVTYYTITKKPPNEIVGVITFHSGKLVKAYRDWTPVDPSAYSLVVAIKGAVEAIKNDGPCTLDTSSVQEPNYLNQGSDLVCGNKYIEISAIDSSRLANKTLVSVFEWLTDFSED